MKSTTVITQTTNWIKSVVIGCNFCPFASKAVLMNRVRFVVVENGTLENSLEVLFEEMRFLDQHEEVETTLIIFPDHYQDFESYLDLVELAENLVAEQDYEGIYQVASFHPDYCFAGEKADDPANFTNRSIYPMLHLLREDSITDVLENYPDAEGIPQRNIDFAQQKGLKYMEALRAACMG